MFNDRDKALKLLDNGMYADTNVSAVIFTLVKYYDYLGYNYLAMKDIIFKWIMKQPVSEYNLKKTEQWFNESYEYIKKHKPIFRDNISVPISLEEIESLNKLKSKYNKLVGFGLLYVSKIFANEKGVFSCKHKTLCKLTGVSEKQVRNSINHMIDNNLLIPIQINKLKTCGYKSPNVRFIYAYPNKYKINFAEGSNIIHLIENKDNVLADYISCFYLCITNYKLKSSRRFKEFIRRNI